MLAGLQDMEVHRHAPCSRDKGTWKGQTLDPTPPPKPSRARGEPRATWPLDLGVTGRETVTDGKGPRRKRDLGPAVAGRAACPGLRPGVWGPRAVVGDLLHRLLCAATCIAGQGVPRQRQQWRSAGKEALSWATFLLGLRWHSELPGST